MIRPCLSRHNTKQNGFIEVHENIIVSMTESLDRRVWKEMGAEVLTTHVIAHVARPIGDDK